VVYQQPVTLKNPTPQNSSQTHELAALHPLPESLKGALSSGPKSRLTKIEYNSDVTFDGAAVDLSHPKGYVCQGLDELLCYGYTGSQVLDTLGNSYQSLGSDTDVFIECLWYS